MGNLIFPEQFGKQRIEIVFWEDPENGEITFIEGQQRVTGFAGAAMNGGEGAQVTFLAKSDKGEVRRFCFTHFGGKVQLFPVKESAIEEPLRALGGR